MALRTGWTRVVTLTVVGMMWLVLGGLVLGVVGVVGIGVLFTLTDRCKRLTRKEAAWSRAAVR